LVGGLFHFACAPASPINCACRHGGVSPLQVKSSEFRLVDKRPKLIPVAYHRPAGRLHFQIRSSGLEGTNDVANVDTGVEVRFREEHGRFPVLARACARVGMGQPLRGRPLHGLRRHVLRWRDQLNARRRYWHPAERDGCRKRDECVVKQASLL
jgi:hypothetical protein